MTKERRYIVIDKFGNILSIHFTRKSAVKNSQKDWGEKVKVASLTWSRA